MNTLTLDRGSIVGISPDVAMLALETEVLNLRRQSDGLLRQLKALAVQLESAGLIVPPGVRAAISDAELLDNNNKTESKN